MSSTISHTVIEVWFLKVSSDSACNYHPRCMLMHTLAKETGKMTRASKLHQPASICMFGGLAVCERRQMLVSAAQLDAPKVEIIPDQSSTQSLPLYILPKPGLSILRQSPLYLAVTLHVDHVASVLILPQTNSILVRVQMEESSLSSKQKLEKLPEPKFEARGTTSSDWQHCGCTCKPRLVLRLTGAVSQT